MVTKVDIFQQQKNNPGFNNKFYKQIHSSLTLTKEIVFKCVKKYNFWVNFVRSLFVRFCLSSTKNDIALKTVNDMRSFSSLNFVWH